MLTLLRRSAPAHADELHTLLTHLLYSYFSRYSAPKRTLEQRYGHLRDRHTEGDFENSTLALEATLSIIEHTAQHLPGFVSHNEQHIARIYNLHLERSGKLLLTTDHLGLQWFGERSSIFI